LRAESETVAAFLGYCPYDPKWSPGKVLTMARKYRGFRQKDLARRLGVDPGTLGKWERDEKKPGGAFLERLEKFFR
jgi:transcriptional regulator with XRE-family HTH domain